MKKAVVIVVIMLLGVFIYSENDATLDETIEWINTKVNQHKHRDMTYFNISNGILTCKIESMYYIELFEGWISSRTARGEETVTYSVNIVDIDYVSVGKSSLYIGTIDNGVRYTKIRGKTTDNLEKYFPEACEEKIKNENGVDDSFSLDLDNNDDIINRLGKAFSHLITLTEPTRKAAEEKKRMEEEEAERQEGLF